MQTAQVERAAEAPRERRSVVGAIAGWLRSRDLRVFLIALGLALVVFAGLLLVLGKDPIATYTAIWQGTLGDSYGWGEIVVKMIPFILCALATAIPARAGLINVGGEGQIYMGAWLATWVALNFGSVPAPVLIPLLIVAGCLGGGLWGGLVGWMRARFSLNETISSLLLNYVASLIIDFFVHGPWKDTSGANWPYTAEFSDNARLATFGTTRISIGIFLAAGALIFYYWLFERTRWGYNMRVVGGNPEAARRSGLSINRYIIAAMLLGGAMAGLYGMIEVTAIQGRLRGGISNGYGYIGFLVAWLAGHQPLRIVAMAALLGLLSVGGDTIQMAGLPSATTNILMALILFFVLGSRRQGLQVKS
jgi:general nucleoside transport system permease protein